MQALARRESLYELEESLLALLDTEEMVSDEQRKEFEDSLHVALAKTVEKRERVGQFLRWIDGQCSNIKAEEDRLAKLKKTYQNTAERMKGYVLRVLEGQGTDEKGRYGKLHGNTVVFGVRSCPASVDIQDAVKVPEKYKTAHVELPAELWHLMFMTIPKDLMDDVLNQATVQSIPDKRAIKAAIEAGEAVPGATLLVGKNSLTVR